MVTDKIHVSLDKGYYGLEVKRRKGNKHQVVTSHGNYRDVYDVVLGLIRYHSDCVIDFNLGGKGRETGAGSDRISIYHPDMNPWILNLHFPLTERDQNLLEGIVLMHNNYQKAVVNKQPELPLALHPS